MKHRIFTVLSVISLALCAAICVLWARSYTTKINRTYEFHWKGRSWELILLNGSFALDDQPQMDLELPDIVRLQDEANKAAERLDDAELELKAKDDAELATQPAADNVAKASRELRSIEAEIGNQAGSQPGSTIPILMVTSRSAPISAVTVAFGILPFMWIVSAAYSRLRRRRPTD